MHESLLKFRESVPRTAAAERKIVSRGVHREYEVLKTRRDFPPAVLERREMNVREKLLDGVATLETGDTTMDHQSFIAK